MASKTVSVAMSAEVREALEYVQERFGFETIAEALEKCVVGFHGRQMALDVHKAKLDKVKAAKKAGRAIPKGVAFKRYVPAFTDAKLDAQGTNKEVATWAHKAPVKVAPVIRKVVKAKPAAQHA